MSKWGIGHEKNRKKVGRGQDQDLLLEISIYVDLDNSPLKDHLLGLQSKNDLTNITALWKPKRLGLISTGKFQIKS